MRHHVVVNEVFFQRPHEGGTPGIKPDVVVDAGVVDEAINLLKLGLGLCDSGPTGLVIGQVELEISPARLQGGEPGAEILRPRVFAEHHRNSALLGQRQRNRRANTAGTAGHDHHLVFQMQVHEFPLVLLKRRWQSQAVTAHGVAAPKCGLRRCIEP